VDLVVVLLLVKEQLHLAVRQRLDKVMLAVQVRLPLVAGAAQVL